MPHLSLSRSLLLCPLSLALLAAGCDAAAQTPIEQYGKRLTSEEVASYRTSPAAVDDTRSVAFPSETFTHLLQQPGAVGISAEFSVDPETGLNTLMLYAVDADYNARGDVMNLALPCPSTCAAVGDDGAGKALAKALLSGGAGRVLSADEIEAHRVATERKIASGAVWFNRFSNALPKRVYTELLAQPDVIGIELRFVRSRKGEDTLLLRAIDSEGRLVGDTVNLSSPCPSTCGLIAE